MGAVHAQSLVQILCADGGSDDRFFSVYPVDLVARLIGRLRVKSLVSGVR